MAEYIDKEELLRKIKEKPVMPFVEKNFLIGILYAAPSADVQPVVHGRDIYNTHPSHCEFKCSVCGAWAGEVAYGSLDGGHFNYCPNCGARMDGVDL